MQNPRKVATKAVQVETIMLLITACQTSGSLKIFSYHSVEKLPNGIVGNLWELKENTKLKAIGINIKINVKNR